MRSDDVRLLRCGELIYFIIIIPFPGDLRVHLNCHVRLAVVIVNLRALLGGTGISSRQRSFSKMLQ